MRPSLPLLLLPALQAACTSPTERLHRPDGDIQATLAAVPLPRATRSTPDAPGPHPRLRVVEGRLTWDDVASWASVDPTLLAQFLQGRSGEPAPWNEGIDLPLDGLAFPPAALRTDQDFLVLPLLPLATASLDHRRALAGFADQPVQADVALWIAASTPWKTVSRAIYTLGQAGWDTMHAIVQGPLGPGGFRVVTPRARGGDLLALMTATDEPCRQATIQVTADATTLFVQEVSITAPAGLLLGADGGGDSGGLHTLPHRDGRPDAPALAALLVPPDLGWCPHAIVAATGAVPWQDVITGMDLLRAAAIPDLMLGVTADGS